MRFLLAGWLCFVAFGGWLGAQEETQDVTDVSLEELLNTPVTVAGKTAQKISDAPAIISVITAAELENMGVQNLYDALSTLPGISVTETSFGYSAVGVRGIMPAHYNNKVLVLLNDHPIYELVWGTFYLEQIPLAAVERIEVIRGPGSILYGTNAYAGVIKVVTRTGKDLGGGELQVTAGSFGTVAPSLAWGMNKGDWDVAGFGMVQETKGFPYEVTRDEEGRSGSFDYENDVLSGLFSARYKGWTAHVNAFRMKKEKFGLIPALVSGGEKDYRAMAADLSGAFTLSEHLELQLSAHADFYDKDENMNWYPPQTTAMEAGVGGPEILKNKNRRGGLDAQLVWQAGEGLKVMAGLGYEAQKTDPQPWVQKETGEISPFGSSSFLESYATHDTSVYLQVDYSPLPSLGLVAGLRLNDNKDYGTKLVPRGGLVWRIAEGFSFKALYGRAFRNPTFFEKYVYTRNVLYGDPDLTPEVIDTVDLGLDMMVGKKASVRFNAFFTETSDLIGRVKMVPAGFFDNTRPSPQYGNSNGERYRGLEAEAKATLGKGLQGFANVSWLMVAEQKDGSGDVPYVPEFMANMGLTWKSGKWTFSPYLQWMGERKGELVSGDPWTVKGYALLHATLACQIDSHWKVQVIGRNLTDTRYAYPEYVRRLIGEIPGGPGLSVYGKVELRF